MSMTNNNTPNTTADALRAKAREAEQAAFDSFERCDTDGCVTQWTHGLNARKLRAEADLVDNGGRSEFVALFDLDGNLVPARLVDTRYGTKFAVFASAADAVRPGAPVVAWVDPFVRPATLARKGYRKGYVLAPARAVYRGSGKGLAGLTSVSVVYERTDGGFDPAAEVVEVEEVER